MVLYRGSPYDIGIQEGKVLSQIIRINVHSFWNSLNAIGISRDKLLDLAFNEYKSIIIESIPFYEDVFEHIKGLADGSNISFKDLLAYNLFKGIFFPEECTMMAAMGDSTATGNVIYLKNSDKVGGYELVGPKYYNYKEINIVRVERFDNGIGVVGVSAAGEVGYKMAINNKGVATGSNIARTIELKTRKVDLTTIRALDRAFLLRIGMMHPTAYDAGKAIVNELLNKPMGTPGNIHFVDANEAYLIEGSYDRVAIARITSGVFARSNQFVIMRELNDPEDVSSYARYIRAMQLLNGKKGKLTREDFVTFSQDHENGPGPNSICRHSKDPRDETSLSAMIMEINRADAESSVVMIALGKPCHAWKNPEGHIITTIRDALNGRIPEGFMNGDVFKKFYIEEPYSAGL